MNETSNINSSSTGGVCSSCLKEMPLIMTSSSSSRICSNCITEFIDPQQQLSSDLNTKFPLFSSTSQSLSSLLQPQQQQQQQQLQQQQQQQQHQFSQSLLQQHFSPLSSSSASSSSSISSSNRRSSGFDPFSSSNDYKSSFLNPLADLNNAFLPLNSSNNDFDSTTNDFMRYFHNFLNGNSNNSNHQNITDRDSPASSIQSNDFSPLFGSSLPSTQNHLPSHSFLQRQHSGFSSMDSTTSSTPSSLNRLSTNELPSSFCCFANNPPYTYCLDCETSLCEKCALSHPKILGFKDHRQQLLSSQTNTTPRSVIGQPIRQNQSQQQQQQQQTDLSLPSTGKRLRFFLVIYLLTHQGHFLFFSTFNTSKFF